MKLLSKMAQAIAKRHASKFPQIVDRQTDPRLYNAIMGKLDKNFNLFSTGKSELFDPEMEILQDAFFNGIGLGELDNLINLIKYGKCAMDGAKYKMLPYLIEYRQALANNLPNLRGRGFVFDLRKGEISEQEINAAMKKIFL